MEFRKELNIKPFKHKISLGDKILLIGSCFSDNLGEKLRQYKFDVRINPNGTLFNPSSICKALHSFIENKQYGTEDLFYHEELWKSWEHHSQFSHENQCEMLNKINDVGTTSQQFLKQANCLIITLGSAWVYERENNSVVANCHKVPADKFNKRLLSSAEVFSMLDKMCDAIHTFNPSLHIIFTISPVRHLRDGFVENNRSKAVLIQAVHEIIEKRENLLYFPAYELVIDDLRDYRFYAEDMAHPNYLATDYVWEKFQQSCIDTESLRHFTNINIINAAKAHKPFQPQSNAHRLFRQKNVQLLRKLQEALPTVNWQEDLDFFTD